jgi:hypothetical protein
MSGLGCSRAPVRPFSLAFFRRHMACNSIGYWWIPPPMTGGVPDSPIRRAHA